MVFDFCGKESTSEMGAAMGSNDRVVMVIRMMAGRADLKV
jgi:hypothetical protein